MELDSLDLLVCATRFPVFHAKHKALRLHYLLPLPRSSESIPTFSFLQVSRARGPASGVAGVSFTLRQ